jgi:hypothetical protein
MIRVTSGNQTVILPLEPIDDSLKEFVDSFCATEYSQFFAPPAAIQMQKGTGIPLPNVNSLPKPEINKFVLPTGASRWGYGLFLATEEQKDLIYWGARSDRPDDRENPWYGAVLEISAPLLSDANLTEEQSDAMRTFRIRGAFLPPRAITPRGVYDGVARLAEGVTDTTEIPNKVYPVAQDLYLLPFVDIRYFWQFVDVGELSAVDLETETNSDHIPAVWNILQHLLDRMSDCAADYQLLSLDDTRKQQYSLAPSFAQHNDYENAAVLLDGLCWQYGLAVVHNQVRVPRVAGDLRNQADFGIVSVQESRFIYEGTEETRADHTGAVNGFAGLGDVVRSASGAVTGFYGNHTFVGLPMLISGGDNLKRLTPSSSSGMEGASNAQSVNILNPDGTLSEQGPPTSFNTKIEWSGGNEVSQSADRISPLARSVKISFDWVTEEDNLPEDLLQIITEDYYKRFYYHFDYTFAGIQKWQQSCFDDYLVMSMCRCGSGYKCTTRAVSWPLNTVPEIHTPIQSTQVSTGSSSDCPCNCIETPNLWVNGVGTTTQWVASVTKEKKWKGENGYISLPAGSYTLTWSAIRSLWVLDIGDLLTARYWDGTNATSDTTMDGEIRMGWTAGAAPYLEICVTGSVPAP